MDGALEINIDPVHIVVESLMVWVESIVASPQVLALRYRKVRSRETKRLMGCKEREEVDKPRRRCHVAQDHNSIHNIPLHIDSPIRDNNHEAIIIMWVDEVDQAES